MLGLSPYQQIVLISGLSCSADCPDQQSVLITINCKYKNCKPCSQSCTIFVLQATKSCVGAGNEDKIFEVPHIWRLQNFAILTGVHIIICSQIFVGGLGMRLG